MRHVTSRENTLANVALEALAAAREPMFPTTPEDAIRARQLPPKTEAALIRGLQSPAELEEWARAVQRQWAIQLKDFRGDLDRAWQRRRSR